MKNKIIVVVEGGNVQYVYSTDPDLKVEMYDFDNVKDESLKDRKKIERTLEAGIKTMHEVY